MISPTAHKKVFIKTYGCQMNVYDSQKIYDVMQQHHNFVAHDSIEDADLIIFNTCSVREKAQEKLFSDIGRLARVKKKNPHLTIAVGGCVASQEGEAIMKRSPLVDIVFGPQTLHRLPALYAQHIQTGAPLWDIDFPAIEKFDHMPITQTEDSKAYVTIMEGCSKFCSFCVVPYTRGAEMSRPLDDVLHEIATLHSQGVKEITLLGQNVNDYRGRMHNGGYASLALLIHYAAALDGIARLRFTTSHPKAFDQSLIEAYASEPKLANQLHLPVQSGSNRILTLMKRGYTIEEFTQKIQQLRIVRPDISITSDFIVGFPGENDEDFAETLGLVEDIVFDSAFSFIYSPRPGTPASLLEDTVTLEKKKERLNQLQNLLQSQFTARSKGLVDTVMPVLLDGLDDKTHSHLIGRTECHRLVHVEGPLSAVHSIQQVLITRATPHALYGNMLSHDIS